MLAHLTMFQHNITVQTCFCDKNIILDKCCTEGYKWQELGQQEISGRGYVKSIFGAKNQKFEEPHDADADADNEEWG